MVEDEGLQLEDEDESQAHEDSESGLEEELERFDEETWEEEGFESFDEYEAWYVGLAKDLLFESKQRWSSIKKIWTNVEKRLEREAATPKMQGPLRTDIPLVEQMIEEAVAVACENLPRPTAAHIQVSQDEFIGALNYRAEKEYEANNIDLKFAKTVLNMRRFGIGVLKQSPNKGTGINKINIETVDPRHCWFDPFATDFHLKDCKYFIYAAPMDLSDIREQWPERGNNVVGEQAYSLNSDEADEMPADRIRVTRGDYTEGVRERALVIELWLNQNTKQFVPVLDENGKPRLDSQGQEIGTWEKKYPNGRLLVIANNVLLYDSENPFDHGDLPYTFFPNRLTGSLLHVGDADALFVIEDKLNRLAKKTLRGIIVQMSNPWLVERHAFDSPEKFKMLSNDEDLVLPITPGAKVTRVPPGIIPPDAFTFMGTLAGYMDDILGLQSVLRGQLEKGAQLSADAVGQLQVSAQARVRLKSRLFESSLKDFGFKLMSNIRQFTDGTVKVTLHDPVTGQDKEVNWKDVKPTDLYDLDIQVGSSLPGTKEMGKQWILKLFDKGLLSKSYTLRNLEVPGAEQEIQYQKDEQQKAIQSGMESAMSGKGPSKAGRKEQEPIV